MNEERRNHVIEVRPATSTRPAQRIYERMAEPGPNYSELQLFHALVRFCRECGQPRCFADWPEKLLREYLLWHLRARTLVWLREDLSLQDKYKPRPILGMGIIWPTTVKRIEECTRTETCVFDWDGTNWDRDAIYIGEFIVRPGVERRKILQCLAWTLWLRWPDGQGKPLYYSRQDRRGHWRSKRLEGRLLTWAGLPQEEVHCG